MNPRRRQKTSFPEREVKQLRKQAFCQFISEIKPICLINNQTVVKHKYIFRRFIVEAINVIWILYESQQESAIHRDWMREWKSTHMRRCSLAAPRGWFFIHNFFSAFNESLRMIHDDFDMTFMMLTYCHGFSLARWCFNHSEWRWDRHWTLESSSVSFRLCCIMACILNLLEFNIFLLTTFHAPLCEDKYLLMAHHINTEKHRQTTTLWVN